MEAMPDHLFPQRPRPVAHAAALTSALALVAVAAGAIVYEACIAHYLRGALGGDAGPWVTTVTIAGTFIGVYTVRPFVARARRPMAMAGRILAVVALTCAAFPYAFGLLFESYVALGTALGPDAPALPLLRLGLAMVAAVPPAAGAAATVPYLATSYVRSTDAPAAGFGHVATFLASGVVLGVILGVWAWVAQFGLHIAMLLVGLGHLALAGALVIVASRMAQAPQPAPAIPWRAEPDRALRAELLAATTFGFAGLAALHAGWTRLAMHVIRPSHEVVWLVRLALALGAVAGAGAAARWIGRGTQPARLAGAGFLAAGGFVLFSLPLYKQLAYGLNTLRNALSATDGGYGLFNAVLLVAMFALAGLATLFASIALPAIWCALTRDPAQWGEDVADVLGAQQLGVLGGLVLAGVAMAEFGLQHTFVLGAICLGCAGGAVLFRHAERRRVVVVALAATAAFTVYAGVAEVGWNGEVMMSRQMRPSADEPNFESFVAEQSRMTTLYDRESATERVQVVELNGVRYLLAEGAYLGNSAQYLVRADEMAALLPWLLHPGEPNDALVVRYGVGISAGALASVGVQVTTAEPYALVPEAARELGAWNSHASDREGLEIHHGDARDLLLFAPQRRYDIIVGSRLPRDIIGAADDSTVQFMALLRSRLAPGGLYAQVLETYGMSEHEFTHTVKTIRASFPWATLWRFADNTALLLAGEAKPTLDFAKIRARLQGRTIPPHAEHPSVTIQTPLELLAHEQISSATLAALFSDKPPLWNRLYPVLAETASRSRFRGDEVATPKRYDERRQAGGERRLMVSDLLAERRPNATELARVAGMVEYTRSTTVTRLLRTAAHTEEIDEAGIDRAILNNQTLPLALARAKRLAAAPTPPGIEICDRYIQSLEGDLRGSRSVFWTADPAIMVSLVERCADEHPDAALPWRLDMATTLRDLGDPQGAVRTARFALEAPGIAAHPRSVLLRIYARANAQLGNRAEARRGFEALLTVKPRDLEAQRYLRPGP
jgi:spermidine synthase